MKRILLSLFFVLLACCQAAVINGPFRALGAAFFFVHKGGPLKLSLRCEPSSAKPSGVPAFLGGDGAVVARIFDAEERLVAWDYIKVKQGNEGRI